MWKKTPHDSAAGKTTQVLLKGLKHRAKSAASCSLGHFKVNLSKASLVRLREGPGSGVGGMVGLL